MKRLFWALPLVALIACAGAGTSAAAPRSAIRSAGPRASAATATRSAARSAAPRASAATATLPPIEHVFTIILENESESTTFGNSPPAPYLATTLKSEGAFIPNFYGIGHASNDNYIAMISGQAPNVDNQEDCQFYSDFPAPATGSDGQEEGVGCVYPADIQTIAGQLGSAGMTWRDYNQSMGNDPTREASECGHPGLNSQDHTQSETATDAYAARHDPFVYFHSIIDDTTLCDSHVVNLNDLPKDLSSASSTPNYVFITPDLCSDGHDATCSDPSRPGGFAGIQQFLQQWVPMITNSAAFKQQDGLLIITFDEASESDSSSCCGEIAGPGTPAPGLSGLGGGQTGAVLLSPCIKPGTVTQTAYNHYSMLRSVEDIFGLPRLGYAQLAGETSFGSDIFTKPCEAPPVPKISARARKTKITVKWSATDIGGPGVASYTVGERTAGKHPGKFKSLNGLGATSKTSAVFIGKQGLSYQFQVKATDWNGIASSYVVSKTVKA